MDVSWTVKTAECWRIDGFELWCWRRLLRVPWTARRSNQSILKEISPGISLEAMMLEYSSTLATSCEELTHWKRPWSWEGMGAGGEGDERGWDGWMASPNRWTWVWVNSRSRWWTGRPGVLQYMGLQRVGHAEWLNWTELNWGTLRNFLPHQNVNFCMHLLYQYGPLASYLTAIITCHNPWPSFISMLILSLIWPGETLQISFGVPIILWILFCFFVCKVF